MNEPDIQSAPQSKGPKPFRVARPMGPGAQFRIGSQEGNKSTRKWIVRAVRYAEIVEREGVPAAEMYRRQFRDQDTMTRALRGEL